MSNNEITVQDQEKMTPEGLVGQIIELETQASAKVAEAKEIQATADLLREKVITQLGTLGIESVRHASGYTATVAHKNTYKLTGIEPIVEKLKANKLTNFITRVPAHDEPNTTLLQTWLKGKTPEQIKEMFGETVEIKSTEYLQLRKK